VSLWFCLFDLSFGRRKADWWGGVAVVVTVVYWALLSGAGTFDTKFHGEFWYLFQRFLCVCVALEMS